MYYFNVDTRKHTQTHTHTDTQTHTHTDKQSDYNNLALQD